MPLAGNLRQFALPDVLRVIESGQRSGCLMLSRGAQRAAIFFSGGQWLLAERLGMNISLAQQLARAGLLIPRQFEATFGLSFAQASSIPEVQLVRTLINARMLTQEQLRAFAVNDALALLSVVLAWPDGEFIFEDGVPLPQGRVALPLPVAPLVTQAMRASAPVRDIVPPAPEMVIDFAEVDPESGIAIHLTREQWKLLTAVDGKMSLAAMVNKLHMPEAQVLHLAGELLAAGTVIAVGRAAPSHA